jgi:hypothetical protein
VVLDVWWIQAVRPSRQPLCRFSHTSVFVFSVVAATLRLVCVCVCVRARVCKRLCMISYVLFIIYLFTYLFIYVLRNSLSLSTEGGWWIRLEHRYLLSTKRNNLLTN